MATIEAKTPGLRTRLPKQTLAQALSAELYDLPEEMKGAASSLLADIQWARRLEMQGFVLRQCVISGSIPVPEGAHDLLQGWYEAGIQGRHHVPKSVIRYPREGGEIAISAVGPEIDGRPGTSEMELLIVRNMGGLRAAFTRASIGIGDKLTDLNVVLNPPARSARVEPPYPKLPEMIEQASVVFSPQPR